MQEVRGPNLAILVVAYRAADKLDDCLRSVCTHLPGLEVHVWDNSGPDHPDVRVLSESYPDVTWHFSESNIGFAAAVNGLAAAVPGSDLLLLNPDAKLLCPLPLTRAALASRNVAAAAPMIFEPDPEPGAQRRESWDVAHRESSLFYYLGYVAGITDRFRNTVFGNLYEGQPSVVSGYLTGACLAISREAWDSVGPFDEQFFLYGEEANWQRRARSAGWKLMLADEVGILHQAMGTTEGDSTLVKRSWDLLHASTALAIEYRYGQFAANAFLSLAGAIGSLRLRIRYRIRPQPGTEFLVTADGPESLLGERISVALMLASAGRSVTVMSLQRLGRLPRDLPTTIRLIRGSWWGPVTAPQRLPRTLVLGTTTRERAVSRLYRMTPGYKCISVPEALALGSQPRG